MYDAVFTLGNACMMQIGIGTGSSAWHKLIGTNIEDGLGFELKQRKVGARRDAPARSTINFNPTALERLWIDRMDKLSNRQD